MLYICSSTSEPTVTAVTWYQYGDIKQDIFNISIHRHWIFLRPSGHVIIIRLPWYWPQVINLEINSFNAHTSEHYFLLKMVRVKAIHYWPCTSILVQVVLAASICTKGGKRMSSPSWLTSLLILVNHSCDLSPIPWYDSPTDWVSPCLIP